MKFKNAILFLLIIAISGCNQNDQIAVLIIEEGNKVKFDDDKIISLSEFSIKFDNWIADRLKVEREPIIYFKPDRTANMKFVNEVKEVLKKYHQLLRIKVETKDGKGMLIRYPPKQSLGDLPNYSLLNSRNLLNFRISNSGVYIDSSKTIKFNISEVKELSLKYILSDGSKKELPKVGKTKVQNLGFVMAANKLVIQVIPSPDLKFELYQALKWEILSAYEDARTVRANEIFGKRYFALSASEKEDIKRVVPIVLSEVTWE